MPVHSWKATDSLYKIRNMEENIIALKGDAAHHIPSQNVSYDMSYHIARMQRNLLASPSGFTDSFKAIANIDRAHLIIWQLDIN